MKNLLTHIAQGLSILLYPMWMPTYGVALFCLALMQGGVQLPAIYWALAVGGTAVLTMVTPMMILLWMRLTKQIDDLYIRDARQRTLPYIYTCICYGAWCYYLIALLHAPRFLCVTAVGATVAVVLVTIINRRWKISAHLTGLGGLIGGVMSYYLSSGAMESVWPGVCCWIVALLLMYARLYLNEHTPGQVVAGLLMGLATCFIPNLIYAL